MSPDANLIAEIETKIDEAFSAVLGCNELAKEDANHALLDVTETLMAGHGTPLDPAKDPVRIYHVNVATGASLLLRHIAVSGLDKLIVPHSNIHRRTREAIAACVSFGVVEDAFFSFWKGYAKANISKNEIIFTPTGSELDARLRAFNSADDLENKGPDFESPMDRDDLGDAFVRSLRRGRVKKGLFDYWIETEVLEALAQAHIEHITKWFGEVPELDLGGFSLRDLILGWSYLRAAATLHRLISSTFAAAPEGAKVQPHPPAMYRPQEYWRDVLRFKNWGPVFAALTLKPGDKAGDVCITPIVPLGRKEFGIIPTVVLRSNVPRNILVLIASRFQDAYSRFSAGREDVLLGAFQKELGRYVLAAKASLPKVGGKQLPDIDLLLGSKEEKRMVVAEVKWQLSASSTREVTSRNDYLKKGSQQLLAIRQFLEANPGYLRQSGRIDFDPDPERVDFMLLCKGHLGNQDVIEKGTLLCDYDVFVDALKKGGLHAALGSARAFDYLPLPEKDFKLVDVGVKFGDWIVRWKKTAPPETTEDNEGDKVEQYYKDSMRYLVR
jgi:hypothetical protein